jgi:hypothetical protein
MTVFLELPYIQIVNSTNGELIRSTWPRRAPKALRLLRGSAPESAKTVWHLVGHALRGCVRPSLCSESGKTVKIDLKYS